MGSERCLGDGPGVRRSPREAAAHRAAAAATRLDALALELRASVAAAYWRVWLVERRGVQLAEQLEVTLALQEVVQSRVAVGAASVADVQQVALRAARIQDELRSIAPARRIREADLRAAIGGAALPEPSIGASLPPIRRIAESRDALQAAVAARPELASIESEALAFESEASGARASRYPGLTVGLDWMETGPARQSGVNGDGRDALAVGFTLSIPVDVSADRARASAALLQAAAVRSRVDGVTVDWRAEIERQSATIEDTAARVRLHEATLLPQAQAVFEARLGRAAAGQEGGAAGVAALLLAQTDLLQIGIERDALHAEHLVAWAALERVVGRPVAGAENGSEPPETPPPVAPTGTDEAHAHDEVAQ